MNAKECRCREGLLRFFPATIRKVLEPLPVWEEIEEVRLRAGRPLLLRLTRGDLFVSPEGDLVNRPERSYLVTFEEISRTVNAATNASVYAFEEEMRHGYLTLPGGHRLGLSGRTVVERGAIRRFRYITGLNVRVAREVRGAAGTILPYVLSGTPPRACHTLIVSPPRSGKTTLLRDLVRQLSNGKAELNFPGATVGLVDERSEVAACFQGVPQLDVGVRTDVLDACPKAEGIRLFVRAFGPDVVATDEIGRAEDARAIEDALSAGVKVVATAHARTLEELQKRPFFRYLFALGVIERFVLLARRTRAGEVAAVLDGAYKPAVPVAGCRFPEGKRQTLIVRS